MRVPMAPDAPRALRLAGTAGQEIALPNFPVLCPGCQRAFRDQDHLVGVYCPESDDYLVYHQFCIH